MNQEISVGLYVGKLDSKSLVRIFTIMSIMEMYHDHDIRPYYPPFPIHDQTDVITIRKLKQVCVVGHCYDCCGGEKGSTKPSVTASLHNFSMFEKRFATCVTPLYVWGCIPWQNWICGVLLALLVTIYFPSIHFSFILLCWTLRFWTRKRRLQSVHDGIHHNLYTKTHKHCIIQWNQ